MARKQTKSTSAGGPAEPVRPKLLLKRQEAKSRFLSQIEEGRRLIELLQSVRTPPTLDSARLELRKWTDYTTELLRRAFTVDDHANAFASTGFSAIFVVAGPRSISEKLDDDLGELRSKTEYLESLTNRLDLIEEATDVADAAPRDRSVASVREFAGQSTSRRVFIVHGHDEEAKAVVARFLEKAELEAVILHEQPNAGRTVIEKFEQHSDVGFAVVLITPDDVGAKKPEPGQSAELRDRARQNVVLELGFFAGRLGRSRVCALVKGSIEMPSDYVGVVYTPMDPGGAWKIALAQELIAAGIDVDLNKALR